MSGVKLLHPLSSRVLMTLHISSHIHDISSSSGSSFWHRLIHLARYLLVILRLKVVKEDYIWLLSWKVSYLSDTRGRDWSFWLEGRRKGLCLIKKVESIILIIIWWVRRLPPLTFTFHFFIHDIRRQSQILCRHQLSLRFRIELRVFFVRLYEEALILLALRRRNLFEEFRSESAISTAFLHFITESIVILKHLLNIINALF